MKRNKCIGIVMMAAGILAATSSCSDFSDYNDVPSDVSAAGNQTLWENISQNSQLTDFAELVKRTGYDSYLNTPRSLTVWAPANGSFDKSAYDNMSDEDVLRQFVKGHIAEYGHLATGKVEERVHMLNDKSFDFLGEGSYTFDGVSVSQANLPSSNGVMHIMNGAAKFLPNLYEYLKVGENIDMLREHFMRYEEERLDQNASVKGPMVNGIQTWIDSVMITSNSLVNQLNARLANEDSSYTFLMPTDKAFQEMYDRVKPYYNFISATKVHDVENYSSASATDVKTSPTINATYMTDSLVRRTIVRNLIYSNNDTYNQWIVGKGEYLDTIKSTTRNKFSNGKEIIEDNIIGKPIRMSNGYGRLVDSLAFYPWETFCGDLVFEPRRYMVKLFPASAQMSTFRVYNNDGTPLTNLFGEDTELTEYRYGWISPGGDRTKPEFFVALPNVMSTTYNFYVVFMPTRLTNGGAVDNRPNWLNFQLNYCTAKGATATYNFSKAYADALISGGTLPAVPSAVNATTAFMNDPTKTTTDTVFIGQFTFPVNYNGLGDEYYPSLRVSSPISVLNNTHLTNYSRDVRIAAILLRPVELEEFEAKNK